MKKLILFVALWLASLGNAQAITLWCANCSTEWTQMMDRITNIEDLRYMTMEYSESLKQTFQQIELLKNNIQQYQNMLQNTENLPQALISQITGDLGTLASLTRSLNTQRADVSAMGAMYDELYPNQEYYQEFASMGREELTDGNILINTEFDEMSQRIDEATRATFQLTGQQLESLENSGELESYINDLLQTPTGQMQALASANQLSSLQLQESRQLRELLATQVQSAASVQARDEKERQLSEEAAREIMDMSDFVTRPQVQELPLF